jgi:soluble lytic murein transglycosylase
MVFFAKKTMKTSINGHAFGVCGVLSVKRNKLLGFLLLLCLTGCGKVLGLSGTDAARRLAAGDPGFIFDQVFPARKPSGSSSPASVPGFPALVKKLRGLKKIDPSAPFYCGLLVRASAKNNAAGGEEGPDSAAGRVISPADRERIAAALFTLSLGSPSPLVRREAAKELIQSVLEASDPAVGKEILKRLNGIAAGGDAPHNAAGSSLLTLRGACLYRQGLYREVENQYPAAGEASSWDRALLLMARCRSLGETKKPAKEVPAAREEISEELRDFLFGLSPDAAWNWVLDETAALGLDFSPLEAGVLKGKSAVSRFRYSLALDLFRPSLEKDPALFLRYPELIAALGRAFQYGSSAGAGETALLEALAEKADPAGAYFCLHYAGRIERQRKHYSPAADYFSRALKLAPNPIQADACLWYLMDIALNDKAEKAAGVLKTLLPHRHSAPYFSDILDRFSRLLCMERQWNTMADLFPLIQDYGEGSVIAQYGWILGRAAQEGYITADPKRFFKRAFEERGASFFYRALSAIPLGERLVPGGAPPPKAGASGIPAPVFSEEREFFLNFIKFGAASLLPPRLGPRLESLSVPELRGIAAAYTAGGFWAEAFALITRYMAREDYETDPRDLTLYYPRPYRELIEKTAEELDLRPELLFGLIRTESAFKAKTVSRSGAVGLTQLMAPTAQEMADRIVRVGGKDLRGGGAPDLRDPETNLYLGAFYLRYLMDHLGGPIPALIAYNGGMGRIRRWQREQNRTGPALPGDLFLETIEYKETREYGRRVLGAAAAYGYLYYGMTMEEVVGDMYP